jgi:HK97 family phage portal protein
LKVIAAAIGIPGFMVGIGTFNKDEYNNFISTTIMSIAMIIQQELSKKLLYSPNMYFKFNPKSLMQYNLTEQVQFVKELVGGGMLNRNEGRAEFDYSPVDVDGMNDYTVLENYLQVADLSKQKKLLKNVR